jgi:GAF domain-containing protein
MTAQAARSSAAGGGSPDDLHAVTAVLHDRRRLAALRRLVPLYRPPNIAFDRLTRLAAELLEAPVALLTLVEEDRQFFVSSHGVGEPLRSTRQTPIDYSICQLTVAGGRPLVIGDTRHDIRSAGNLAVIEFGVAAYAGMPLITPDGHAVGTLCVIDFVPRDWTDDGLAILADLAAVCMDELRLAGLDRQMAFDSEWKDLANRSAWHLQ